MFTVITGVGGRGYVNGTLQTSQFNKPNDVAIDCNNNIIVADPGNNAIRMISSDGTVSTIAGDGVKGFNDGYSDTARFDSPVGISVDSNNNVLIADYNNHRIRKLNRADGIVSTVAGDGTAGYVDGEASQARFCKPHGNCN